ncbi:MAG TPA: DUF1259 domain-containing protein [Chthoniobacterales bacterium]
MLRRTGLLLGSAGALAGIRSVSRVAAASTPAPESKTPPLSKDAMAAMDAALGGKKGSYVEKEGVYTTPLPRNDLKITIKDEPVPIGLGFGGWVSIKRTLDGEKAMLMSDTVLLQEEVNPLISAAQDHGLQVTALHNHFFYESPRIFYMHLHGMGDAAELAAKYGAAIQGTKLHPSNQPPATASSGGSTAKEAFDLAALDKAIGLTGKVNGPIYKYVVGRDDLQVIAMGAEVTTAIGLNTWAAFAGNSDAAHIAGDVAMLESEVNSVIRALRKHDLEVVAVHQHMLEEQPRIIFLHYYGSGPALTLAEGFHAALEQLGGKEKQAGG